jgi:hypothetical protein
MQRRSVTVEALVEPSCTEVAELQVRYGLGLNALLADISHSAASAFPNADWGPAMTELDHKGPDTDRNGCSIGSSADGIIYVVGPLSNCCAVANHAIYTVLQLPQL